MQCEKCKIKAQLDELLAKHPDGNVPEDERARLINACVVCSHGCVDAKGKPRCRLYPRKTALQKELARLKKSLAEKAATVENIKKKGKPDLYGFALAVETGRYNAEKTFLENRQKAYDAILRECAECSRSADDNPSNSGQCFVSIDEGTSGDPLSDTNDAVADWLLEKRISPRNPSSGDPNARPQQRATSLPEQVEDALRMQLSAFSQLDLADKFLVCVLMTNKPRSNDRFHTIADFAKKFAPYVFGRSISKQAAHARYIRIVKRMPVLAAIAHGQIGRGKGGGKRHALDTEEAQMEFNFR